MDKIRIGVDVDDVIFRTSDMITDMAPDILRRLGYNGVLNREYYDLPAVLNVDADTAKRVESQLGWCLPEYINWDAVSMLHALRTSRPVEFDIVTWRPEVDALPVSDVINKAYPGLFDNIYCLEPNTSKASFCDKHGITAMLDDYENNIKDFQSANTVCKAVLISPDNVPHNKRFAKTYSLTLTNWNQLIDMYDRIMLSSITA